MRDETTSYQRVKIEVMRVKIARRRIIRISGEFLLRQHCEAVIVS